MVTSVTPLIFLAGLVAFSRAAGRAEDNSELFQVPVAGGQPEKVGISLTGRLQYPQVHPDGRRIVFWSRQQGAIEVWALDNFLPKPGAAK